ncbi:MAG TPA: imelysin family protein [Polyangiaceae bacterium]|nr:imelysin family protein [Polyangiaceae bacterium]
MALQGTTERVIMPTHHELRERARELSALLDELASDPATADLAATRQAYLDVRGPLEEAEAFAFGPAEDLNTFKSIDSAPVDTAKIDAELTSDVELSATQVSKLGTNKRGLHAIEYLLFPADDAELEAALLADDVSGERRRQFASAAGQLVASAARELELAWQPEKGDFARRFTEPGAPDSVDATVQAGLDTLLNQTVVVSEVLANVKLGKPLGADTGGKVDAALQESGRAQASLSDMLGNLRGVRNIYRGTRDDERVTSLSTLVHAKSPAADVHALDALDEAEVALRDLPEPLDDALTEAPEKVQQAYDAVKQLKRVLATEVLSTLGASLTFSDNDGD